MPGKKAFWNRLYLLATVLVAVGCAAAATATLSGAKMDRGPVQAPNNEITGNVWLIFIDDLHLDFPATGRHKALFKTVTTELVREGDLVGVVSTGPSSIAIDLTGDRGRLNQALEKLSGAALKPSEIIWDADKDTSEVRYRAHVSFRTAYDVLKMLALVPNTRKAFIYISNGYYFDVWPGSLRTSATNPFSFEGNVISLDRLRDEVTELTSQAKRANVTIYGIDPRGLSGPPVVDPKNVTIYEIDPRGVSRPPVVLPKIDDAAWQKYWTTTRNSLQVIAEQTGGFVIQDELESGLKRIAAAKGR
jgi:VWFA-related protein